MFLVFGFWFIDIAIYVCYHTSVFKSLLDGLCDLVYPPYCLLCRKQNPPHSLKEILCPQCQNSIQFNRPPFCLKCSRHLDDHDLSPRCANCSQTELHFDFAWGACLYKDPLRDFIHQFKYHEKTLFRNLFTRLMTTFIHSYHLDIQQFDAILPIPLSSTRHRERGFNQSQLLAQGISEQFSIPMSLDHLQKVRHTKHQTQLSQKERWTNVNGAFRIKHSREFLDKNILLVDDLLTTGATASEAALILKKAGANRVGILTLAIAV